MFSGSATRLRACPPRGFSVPMQSPPHPFGIWGKPLPTPCPHMFSTGKPVRPVYFSVENFGVGRGLKTGRLFLLHTRWIASKQVNAHCPTWATWLSTA